jgi:hypothetical protein
MADMNRPIDVLNTRIFFADFGSVVSVRKTKVPSIGTLQYRRVRSLGFESDTEMFRQIKALTAK